MKIPDHWDRITVTRFLKDIDENIETLIPKQYKHDPKKDLCSIRDTDIKQYKELYGFKCNPDGSIIQFSFVKLRFISNTAMNKYSEAIRNKYSLLKRQTNRQYDKLYREWIDLDKDDNCDSHLFESNVHPMIRFIHETKIEPANWIEIQVDDNEIYSDSSYPNVDIVLDDIHYTDIKPFENESISPYIIASFDIECDSSHGDFPLATKDMKKLALDIYDSLNRAYEKNACLDTILYYVKRCIKAGFNEKDRSMIKEIEPCIDINPIYTKDDCKPCKESIDSCYKLFENKTFMNDLFNPKQRDAVIKLLTKELNKLYDEDDDKLEVEGDKVIQIGTVFHKYGEEKPYKRHILVIAPEDNLPDSEICDDIDNIEVIRCKNEKQLLLGWKNIIKEVDPDYITGYNIFGFDFAYMYDRMKTYCHCNNKWCKRNCPLNLFLNCGKINSLYAYNHRNKKCKEVKKKTSSFGATDFNRYLHMDGRIIYDLQKEVEKGHNLESYKLDNVAAHFMRGKIKQITSFKDKDECYLYTNEFGNLKIGDYISLRLHSNIGETYYNDNQKFKIKQLINKDNPYIIVSNTIIIDESHNWNPLKSDYFKIEWCLMKDDVSPQDIFNFHKSGGPSGRALVAKYCIQDCELCINLTLALDIIPNNIAMANVCLVPQSYIYLSLVRVLRSFSLISSECDKAGIRIPTLNKPFTGHEYVKLYKSWRVPWKKKHKMKQLLINERYKEWYGDTWKQQKQDDIINDASWVPYKDYAIDDEVSIITTDNPPPRQGYEGAIVLDPVPGIYLDDPVGVVDYASLYPSSIIEKNISHDTLIKDKKYLDYLGKDNYETIKYTNYIYEEEDGKVTITKKQSLVEPEIVCHYLKKKKLCRTYGNYTHGSG